VEDLTKKRFPARPKIVFMGTPEFAVPALKTLIENGHEVLSVITQPDRPKGRGKKIVPSPVKQAATAYELEVLQPEKASAPQFCEIIRGKRPDLLVVVAFGQILKKNLLDIPSWGVLNIHASLLPKYRGAAPIQWAIINNEAKTGLTALLMDEGLDTGPILLQQEVSLLPNETAGQLHDRLSALAGDFLVRTLKDLAENRLRERPQDQAKSTYAPKIDRDMSLITWEKPAETVSALIRALDPWPGAFTKVRGKDIKIFSSQVVDKEWIGLPGRVAGHDESGLMVETGKGTVKIGELQIPGKKRLSAKDFLRGFPLDKGTLLGS
jgi:methionyl-tRNA formyltransferase